MVFIAELPALVGPPYSTEGVPREHWLDRMRFCRRRLRAMLLREGAISADAGSAIDQALELMLLDRFIRSRRPLALPQLNIPPEGMTPHELCQSLSQTTGSQILHAVLDAADFCASEPLPQNVWHAAFEADMEWRNQQGCRVSLPPIALGEFRQLCLAECDDAGKTGQRRARGIHYTPAPLADYLTCRVLDRLIASRASLPSLRILDPSCGGGTFLIAALRYLLQRQSDLSPQLALDMLGATLFGSDIDPGAVVITRRALFLTVWDVVAAMETEASREELRVPDLRQNITSQDFLDSRNPPGQFHAILGGPPFVRIHEMRRSDMGRVEQYRAKYRTARSGQFDLYMPFFEEALRQLAEGGWLGWSVANTFLRTSTGRVLRSVIGECCCVHELAEFEDSKIYPDAVTQIVLVMLEKGRPQASCRHAWIKGAGGLRDKLSALRLGETDHPNIAIRELPASACIGSDWSLGSAGETSLLNRVLNAGIPFEHLPVSICQGLVTGADHVFLLRCGPSTNDGETVVQGRNHRRAFFVETPLLRPIIRNRNIRGYARVSSRTACLAPYDHAGQLFPEPVLRDHYPLAYKYLLNHREVLVRRRGMKPPDWYALRSASCLSLAAGPRVLLKLICSGGDFTLDSAGQYLGHSGTLMLVADGKEVDPFYLLGVLNSRVFWFFVRQTMPTMGHGRHVIRRAALRRFPLVISNSGLSSREQIADDVRTLLAGLADPDRSQLLAGIDERVAGLYGIDSAELAANSSNTV